MKTTFSVALLITSVVLVTAATNHDVVSIAYDIVAVQGKLFLEVEPEAHRLSVGDQAISGDRLRTGSSSSATIGVPSHTTVFRLSAKTTCTLAHDRPGVLLHVEKGRLRALFGTFTGTDPRLVTTPSAVLAVRGTEYGLKVKKNGDTQIVVFDGVVEVTDPAGESPPIRVEAGQQTRVRHGRPIDAPAPHHLSPDDWDRGRTSSPQGMSGSGSYPGSQSGSFGSTGTGSSGSGGGSNRRGG